MTLTRQDVASGGFDRRLGNEEQRAVITVRDLLGVALPAGTRVVAGGAGLDGEVTWATRVRPTPPAFGHLSGGEIVLLAGTLLSLLDERLTLAAAIRQLASFGVAAVAYAGDVDQAAGHAADETGIPLLQLPLETELGSLERELARYITDRRRAVLRRGQEAGRKLMEAAIAGEPLATVVRTLSELANRPVALEGRDGRLLTYQLASEGPGAEPPLIHVEPDLASSYATVLTWLRSAGASSPAEPPSSVVPLNHQWVRVVSPVIGRDGLLGSVSLIAPSEGVIPEDLVLAARGAAACAVVLAREQAAANVRREVELNVLDEVLDGALRSEVSLLQQARRLGHDLEAPHVAVLARIERPPSTGGSAVLRQRENRWSGLEDLMTRIASASGLRNGRPMWRVRNNVAEIVWPLSAPEHVQRLIRTMRDEMLAYARASSTSGDLVSLGYGRVGSGIRGIRQSHQEARQALSLGRRLNGPGHVTGFDDLGVYRVIYAAEGVPELRAFHDEVLSSLLAYDKQHGADLIRTLDAFFRANCSPKEAAVLLGVHRNTVLYRLDRISEITSMNLDDSDVRLRLQFALRIHTALYGDE
jgi:purine catabolism regulator